MQAAPEAATASEASASVGPLRRHAVSCRRIRRAVPSARATSLQIDTLGLGPPCGRFWTAVLRWALVPLRNLFEAAPRRFLRRQQCPVWAPTAQVPGETAATECTSAPR